ncbi:hypothetical protein ASE36_20600 [Rhizobium sp. Root274]|nr:hypothetical protein ASE36_20600 [Rhizobium sp. Root274]
MFALSWKSDTDSLAEYRPRIGALISALGSALLFPFIILQALQGRWGLAALFAATAIMLLVNVWAVNKRHKPFIPFAPVVAGLTLAVCISVWVQGHNGVLWSYPVLFIGFFILARRLANLIGLALILGVSFATWQSIGVSLASRVATTLFLNFVMINLVLNVLDHLYEALTRQALLDPLTGAYNRRQFQKRLNAAWAASQQGAFLLVFDIDHFKRINDAYGHDVGDDVLRAIVELTQSVKRPEDELFRLGGEEFALLLPKATPELALQIGEAVRRRVESDPLIPHRDSAVTVSIGVAGKQIAEGADRWYKQADLALYAAKRKGRNRVVYFDLLNEVRDVEPASPSIEGAERTKVA